MSAVRRTALFGLLVLCSCPGQAQDVRGMQAQGALEISSGTVRGAPLGRSAENFGFLRETGRTRLNQATLNIEGEWTRWGFHAEGGVGDFYRIGSEVDTWKGPNQYVSQAYVVWKPLTAFPLRLEAGKFYSSVGAEVPEEYAPQNTQATRSLLFWYGEPLFHAGVRASLPLNTAWSIGAQLLSGSNTITGAHGHQSVVFTTGWTGRKWGWSQLYMGGNQKRDGRGWRQISDSIVTFTPSSRVRGYAELLLATEKEVGPGSARWGGVATSWKYNVREKWSVGPRVEWYGDPQGATTRLAQHLFEATLTGEYRPRAFAIARLEYRRDWSTMPFYEREDGRGFDKRRSGLVASLILIVQRRL